MRLFMTLLFVALLLGDLASCGSTSSAKTPTSCLQALDAAEAVINKSASAISLANDAVSAILADDTQAFTNINGRLKALADTVGADADQYRRLAAECRGGS